MIEELGLSAAVNLAGSVSGAELEAYDDAADVFVMASDHEGFCVPLAEAMGHGVPIVAYGVTAVPETVGGAGLVLDDKSPVPFAAAVGRVFARRNPAWRAGRGGRKRAAGFDLAASTRRFVSFSAGRRGVLTGVSPATPGWRRRRGRRPKADRAPRLADGRRGPALRTETRHRARGDGTGRSAYGSVASTRRPASPTTSGSAPASIGHDGQAHGHRLEDRYAEAFVPGAEHEHVRAPHRSDEGGVAQAAGEIHGVVESHLGRRKRRRASLRQIRRAGRPPRVSPCGRSAPACRRGDP